MLQSDRIFRRHIHIMAAVILRSQTFAPVLSRASPNSGGTQAVRSGLPARQRRCTRHAGHSFSRADTRQTGSDGSRTHAINASLSAVPPKHASTSLVRTRLLLPGESAGLESIHCGVLKCANSAVQFIQPTLQHHEAHIDRSISEAQASAQASWKLFAARGRSKLHDSA